MTDILRWSTIKKLALVVFVILYLFLVGEKEIPEECVEPLNAFDQLIQRSDISEQERKQFIVLRQQLVLAAKSATTAHFIMLTCIGAYNKIDIIRQQLDKKYPYEH